MFEKKSFSIKTKKGNIFSIFFLPRKSKKVPIILTHGSADNCNQYPLVNIAKFLSEKGFITIRFDFRGCGNSDGKEEDYCLSSQIYDLENVINFVKKKFKAKKVGIIAKSISCVPAAIVASKRKDISFIVFLGPPLNIEKYWSEEEIKLAKEKGYIFFKGFKYGYRYGIEMKNFKEKYLEALSKLKIPVLAIFGEKDEIVDEKEREEVFKLIDSKDKKLTIIENADHSFKNEENNLTQLIKEINSFLINRISEKG